MMDQSYYQVDVTLNSTRDDGVGLMVIVETTGHSQMTQNKWLMVEMITSDAVNRRQLLPTN